jgi:hypothetical protein
MRVEYREGGRIYRLPLEKPEEAEVLRRLWKLQRRFQR